MTHRQLVSLVDDDGSLRQSVRNLLSSVGIEVATFASAEAFLESEDIEDTGCLILDFRLEGMSGLELTTHLSAAGRQIPIVMLTGHGDAALRQRSLAAGAQAFLTKPFRANELLDAVKVALGTVGSP
jgi:FixJ family two-component response regulator